MRISASAKTTLVVMLAAAVGLAVGRLGPSLRRHYDANRMCCVVPAYANLLLSAKETLGLVSFASEIGQDKWISETVFPGVTDGYFVDVGSGDGVIGSNTVVIERKGWKGICVDPLPTNMEGRTCQMFREVVFDEAGKTVTFHTAGGLAGVAETLGAWRKEAETFPTLQFTTVTLGDILNRAHAPAYIHFMSLDIEGAELAALQGLPFDKYRFGAFAIEHNFEEPKRTEIRKLLERYGYSRVHSFEQDDFYLPEGPEHGRRATATK